METNAVYVVGQRLIPKREKSHQLVADHIDGDWRNNVENNLRLICPNCDSLTSTYAALNRGNGRKNRAISKRAKEGHLLMNMPKQFSGRTLLS